MRLPILRLDERAKIPAYETAGAAAFDLSVIESATIAPGDIARLRTGLVFCIPEGHYLLVASRSSNPEKKGINLANSIGIIDSDYCGPEDELFILVQNITKETITINEGDRVAQGLVLPVHQVLFEEVESVSSPSRGGIGSTGR